MSVFTDPSNLSHANLLQLFNLQDEQVQEIAITHKDGTMNVYIILEKQECTCPACGAKTSTIKDYTIKKILHSLITHIPCRIIYKARRMKCNICSKSFYEPNPFVYRNMKISTLTVSNVLRDLKNANETFTSVARRYRISDTTVASIFDAHVSVPRRKLPTYMNIDEVYAFSSNDGDYVCVLVDFETGNTIDLLPSRRSADLKKYFNLIPLEEREKVQLVGIDLWHGYRTVVKHCFPNALVVSDRFHVFQELHRKIQTVRINIMNREKPKKVNKPKKNLSIEAYEEYKRRDNNYYLLKKFHWLLQKDGDSKTWTTDVMGERVETTLLNPNNEKKYNKKLGMYLNYYDINDKLLAIDDDLKTVMDLKSQFEKFMKETTYEKSKEEIEKLISDFSSSGIKEMISFSQTMIRWKNEIMNSLIVLDPKTGQRMNSGIIENRNKVIKQMKHNSNGFKSWDRFRNRALYVLNKDATYRLNPFNLKED
jgi:Transposase and inactivated derivatives